MFKHIRFIYSILVVYSTIYLIVGEQQADTDKTKKKTNLFPVDHPNVTHLTDGNWNATVWDSELPWVIDFYHPYCPHCKHFVPEWEKIAAYYKAVGGVRVGAVSCMEEVMCRRMEVKGFPTLVAYNFDLRGKGENERLIGTHTLEQVQEFVNKWLAVRNPPAADQSNAPVATDAAVVVAPPTVKPSPTPIPIWEETTKTSVPKTRLQDAASALMFGLKDGVFTGREVLDDMELDALKEWLRVLSKTFPGIFNRQLITKLWNQVKYRPYLDLTTWTKILNEWQLYTVAAAKEQNIGHVHSVPEWQKIPDLFAGDGTEYTFCGGYTCAQWTLFHMMTVNPVNEGSRDNELPVEVIAAIRRFVKHFFTCSECRGHFLAANPLKVVDKIFNAPDRKKAIRYWLWEMHNKVNQRIGHPHWPKPSVCSDCGEKGAWNEENVDRWLLSFYGYQDAAAPVYYPSVKANTLISEEMAPNGLSAVYFLFVVPAVLFFVYRRLGKKGHHAH